MAAQRFRDFLQDERGSYTLWSLIWFMMYVAIGGLAVDGTDGYRVKTGLQATADAAALAAVMSVGSNQDPVAVALNYAKANMPESLHGTVLKATDVHIGVWDFTAEHFTEGGAEPNAVYVVTQRSAENQNAVLMSMLRILQGFGLDAWWNIRADAIAVMGVNKCANEGLIAGDHLLFNPHTDFVNYICLIGVKGFDVASSGQNLPGFDDTVYAGVDCDVSDGCVGPGQNPWNNEEFMNAFGYPEDPHYNVGMGPDNAEMVKNYIDTLLDWAENNPTLSLENLNKNTPGVDYEDWDYLVLDAENGGAPLYVEVTAAQFNTLAAAGPLPKHTVYNVTSCTKGKTFDMPAGTYDGVAIVITANCSLNFASGAYAITDSLLAATKTSNTTNGYGDPAISATSNVDVTLGTNCDNGIEMYSMGNINFASGANVAGSRVLANGNVHFAAKADGYGGGAGVHIEAMGNIDPASGSKSGSKWGLCAGDYNGPKVLSYALVR